MIKPTVGRVVWFWPGRKDESLQPQAAIVVHVWSETCVNLAVFDANGVASSHTSILLHQEGNSQPTAYFAEWMPYQIGQAAKTEALQTKLGDTK